MPFFSRWISSTELRLSTRILRKQPIATITTMLALTVGIGMATTGFTLLDSVVYSRLPFPNGDRFVLLEVLSEPEAVRSSLERERFRFFSEHTTALEHLGAFRGTEVNLLLPSTEIVPVSAAAVTADSIRVFPYAPVLGRVLQASDGQPGAPPVVLLRESLWRRHFSADPRVIGRTAVISGIPRTVVGVMPDDFKFPTSGEMWLPLTDTASARAFGVLRSGHEPAVASAQLGALTKQFEAATPGVPRLRVNVVRFTEAMSRGLELVTGILVATLVVVLLVIASNIANLVLARTFARARELAVRTALGATRRRLVAQIFSEVLILGVVAAAAGLAASQATLDWVKRTLTDMPFWIDFTATPRTMVFVVCTTLLASAVAGVLPALKATRRDTAAVLAATTRGASAGFGKLGGTMVALQVALSIALLNGALVMARGVAGYMRPALLVPAGEVLTARVVTEKVEHRAIVEAVASMPGVVAAGVSSSLPGLSPSTEMTQIEDASADAQPAVRPAPVVAVGAGFFGTLGATARAGRLFRANDYAADAPPVAVVNQPFVDKFLRGANPLGRRLRVVSSTPGAPEEPWREIVGVVPDLGLSAGDPNMAAGFYVPMGREPIFHLALRTSGDARRLTSALRATVSRIDPDIQLREVQPLQDVGREDRAVFAGIGMALGALGVMALLLSIIGTYATLSLNVTRRTREIGIRTALGASRAQVLRAVAGRISVPPVIGAIAGIALGQALVAARGIFAFRLPDGSGAFGLVALAAMMIVAGLMAAWVPVRRALAVAPADALRAE